VGEGGREGGRAEVGRHRGHESAIGGFVSCCLDSSLVGVTVALAAGFMSVGANIGIGLKPGGRSAMSLILSELGQGTCVTDLACLNVL
jgi:hypothetical protein